mmetsp:Transcript_36624/g.56183  ORF Transcript_36624/g.56183 Transcript_36624/m.56183 type:complete len:87 (+) Transcript_36624:723-983(+)
MTATGKPEGKKKVIQSQIQTRKSSINDLPKMKFMNLQKMPLNTALSSKKTSRAPSEYRIAPGEGDKKGASPSASIDSPSTQNMNEI